MIFVPTQEIDENTAEHFQVVDWANNNLESSNILLLSDDDVYLLQDDSQILAIINEENNGMLQMGEDDWIIAAPIKIKIRERLKDYLQSIKDNRIKKITQDLIRLLDISIVTEKNLYFIF